MSSASGLLMIFLLSISLGLDASSRNWLSVWPSVAALIVIFISKKTLPGLLLGSVIGASMLSSGFIHFFRNLVYRPSLFVDDESMESISNFIHTFTRRIFRTFGARWGGLTL